MSLRLEKRKAYLSEVLLFLSAVKIEIEYITTPLVDILEKLINEKNCKSLDFLPFCLQGLSEGKSLKQAWESSISKSRLPMTNEEREKLISLGSFLGTSDIVGQLALLELYCGFFSSFYERASLEKEKKGTMSLVLGSLIGMGLFIMFI